MIKRSKPSGASTVPMRQDGVAPGLSLARSAFYAELPDLWLAPLWNALGEALTPEPHVRSLPHLWKWSVVREKLVRAGELVTAAEAERRVLYFLNPGLPPAELKAVGTLYSGVQLILPGEVARTHHHTPAANRFIIEGELAYTTVSGERTVLHKGDYVTTPNWTWHDHGNDSAQPMFWLDGLDLPFVTELDAVFFELFETKTGDQVQPVTRSLDDSTHRWSKNLRPTYERHSSPFSPILNYRWVDSRGALHALSNDKGNAYDGVILEFINPVTGGPSLPTMSAYIQLLRKGEHGKCHRHTSSTVYHVAEGRGFSVIGGTRFDWEEGDTFVLPSWSWHEHASLDGEAVLFSFSDRPLLAAFDLYREQAGRD